jgi:hypothetical protein
MGQDCIKVLAFNLYLTGAGTAIEVSAKASNTSSFVEADVETLIHPLSYYLE